MLLAVANCARQQTKKSSANGAVAGYASAVGLEDSFQFREPGIYVIADPSIEIGGNFVVGANEAWLSFPGRKLPARLSPSVEMTDIAQADTGHRCTICGGQPESPARH